MADCRQTIEEVLPFDADLPQLTVTSRKPQHAERFLHTVGQAPIVEFLSVSANRDQRSGGHDLPMSRTMTWISLTQEETVIEVMFAGGAQLC